MYLLYEHLKDSEGALLATDMILTSTFPGKPWVNLKNLKENVLFTSTKDKVFKAVAISERNYDPDTHIWTFFAGAGAWVYKQIKDSKLLELGLKIQKIERLAEQIRTKYISAPIAEIFDPSDFFYTPSAPVPSGPSKEQAAKQLAAIFGIDAKELIAGNDLDLKKHYRRAALRLHPDRPENSGNLNGMTELNFLWQVYNG